MSVIGSTGSAADIRSDYMNLLITQLQNQNPLDPMDNNEMAGQLTQLSQLEQLENMTSVFNKLLTAEQSGQASGLIGKTISFFPKGALTAVTGKVEGVELVDGESRMVVGEYRVKLQDVQTITDTNATQTL